MRETAYPSAVALDNPAGGQSLYATGQETDLGNRLAKLRRMAKLTQEQMAERSGVSVDVIRKLEQHRRHSARLPTLHALANGLGVEVAALLSDPASAAPDGDPAASSLVELRRAVVPSLVAKTSGVSDPESMSTSVLWQQIAEGWSLYLASDFAQLALMLPGVIADARLFASGGAEREATGSAVLVKALQLAGHLALRLGKTDLALSALERAADAAGDCGDPLMSSTVLSSIACVYQHQNRLADSQELAVTAADTVERGKLDNAAKVRVWGGLVITGATSVASMGNYDQAREMMTTAEEVARRLATLPPPAGDPRLLPIFSESSVRIERIRLAMRHARPEEALVLAKGTRLSPDIPPSWRTGLLLDMAQVYAAVGDAERAVQTLERLRRVAPLWMRRQTLAAAIVTSLWARSSRPAGLRKLAEYLGVAA